MPRIDAQVLSQRWLHSHEEDTDDEKIFRPSDYDFPPTRGRAGFDLKPDGNYVQIGIGATDRPTEISGNWQLLGDRLVLHTPSRSPAIQSYKILNLSKKRLVLER